MKSSIAVAVLLLVSAAMGLSQVPAPSVAPLSADALAAILDQPSATACPEPQQQDLVFAARRQGNYFKACNASATCNDTSGVSVNCHYFGPGGSCSAEEQDCANGIQGYALCNGVYSFCPECPSTCGSQACCDCKSTGDCFSCCRCSGGSISLCINQC
jgi:hypothetical protein